MNRLALFLALFLGFAAPAFAACPANTGNALTTGTDEQVIRDALVEVCGVGLGVGVTTADFDAKIGSVTETAPATDTASSGLNGRLQRIAQRITSLIALLPSALGQSGGLKVESQVATTGGPTMYSANVTTAGSGAGTGGVAVDASAGMVYGYAIFNGNSSVCYIQFFDQTQALTNLGTTVPKMAIGIPANGGANLMTTTGLGAFATAITIGATTTRNGSTACSTGLDINIWYK